MKKKLVFEIGDVVYHKVNGKGVIKKRDSSDVPYEVRYDNKCIQWVADEQMLSFEPWPAPVHERPFKAGWYVCKRRNVGLLMIVNHKERESNTIYCHYLGEKLPEEWNTEKGIV